MVVAVMILLAVTMTKMIKIIIGGPEVAIRVIKGIARAEQRAVVIQTVVCIRAADSTVEQEEKILVLMNWLMRYVCLNIVSIWINLATNTRKQSKQPENMICSCSTSNMVFMTPQSPSRSFVLLLRSWQKQNFQLLPCPHEPYTLIHPMNACPLY
jgi:hypothetical protein